MVGNIKSLENLYKKYNGKTLDDAGAYVSKEYANFQNAFIRMMKDVASAIGAEIVKKGKGHYDGFLFLKRGEKYVYVDFGTSINRTHIDFDSTGCMNFLYCRTAESEKDFHGGTNNFVSLKQLPETIDRLLN